MKITVWLARSHRATWIAAAETSTLALLLFSGPGTLVRVLVGMPVLAHLAYTAMTGLPIGTLPKRPVNVKRDRQNQELRSNVIGFLNQVRRVEEYAQRAQTGGVPVPEVERHLEAGRDRIMAAASQVAEVTGRATPKEADETGSRAPGRRVADDRAGHAGEADVVSAIRAALSLG